MPLLRRLSTYLRRSLRIKVTLGAVVPLVLILGLFTTIQHRRQRTVVLAELSSIASSSGNLIERSLRHEMMESDFAGVQEYLDTLDEKEQFRVVYLLDTNGRVIFSPNNEGVGTLLDNSAPDCQPCHRLPPEARPTSVTVEADDGQRVFRSMLPIENGPACRECHDPDQRMLGLLLTDIPTSPLEEQLAASLRENMLWSAGTILVTVIIVNLVMSRLIISRLEKTAQTLARFGHGQHDLRLRENNPDEIGQLACAFNEMGRNIHREQSRSEALSDDVRSHAARRQELLKRLITAQEEERRRVAHDLHDDLGQDLAGLAVSLQGIEGLWSDPPDLARRRLQAIHTQIAQMTDRTYDIIVALRPAALDDLGLVPTLRAHVERTFKDAGIQFQLKTQDLTGRLQSEIETVVFRTLQEALSNVVRHARANHVSLSLAVRDGMLEGEVSDDGCGFDPATIPADGAGPRGLGLLGMQERVALIGGTLRVDSCPGGGTRVHIHIPLPEPSRG